MNFPSFDGNCCPCFYVVASRRTNKSLPRLAIRRASYLWNRWRSVLKLGVCMCLQAMPPKTWRPTSSSAPAFIEARRAKLEDFLRKVLTSPMVDARRNPYVLQFLGLAQPPLAASANDDTLARQVGDHDTAATRPPVYRPLIVKMQQTPLKRLGSSGGRQTSAEHRASMHRHYKSTERQPGSSTSSCDGGNGGDAAAGGSVAAAANDAERQPEAHIATDQSEELLGLDIVGGGAAAATPLSTPSKLFDDDTSDDDAI